MPHALRGVDAVRKCAGDVWVLTTRHKGCSSSCGQRDAKHMREPAAGYFISRLSVPNVRPSPECGMFLVWPLHTALTSETTVDGQSSS